MNINIGSSRGKSISIEIRKSGELLVRAPKWMPRSEIDKYIESKSEWIEKTMEAVRLREEKEGVIQYFTETELNHLVRLAKRTIPQRVAYYAPIVGVDYNRITIRKQQTRWGSCTSSGNLNFNALLLMAPPEVLDSVVVHELCHRLQMNHSKAFYKEVYRVFPDYDRCDKWLKENGKKLLLRLPQAGENNECR